MIYDAIKHLFPGIADAEFSLQDDSDGRGPYIARWDRPEPMPTMAQIEAAYPAAQANQLKVDASAQVQKRLDDFAATRRYDNVNSASKYRDISDAEIAALAPEDQAIVARYRAECRYLTLATAQTWAAMERIEAQVEADVAAGGALPTLAEVMAQLPALAWPTA